MNPAETVLTRSMLWSTVGVAAAIPAFVLPGAQDPLIPMVAHLTLAALFSMGLAWHLSSLVSEEWFAGSAMSIGVRAAVGGIAVAGAASAALVPGLLATGVAIRYAPSMQYFLVGSGLVIAAVSTIALIGLRARWSGIVPLSGGGAVAAVCIVAVGRYLDATGSGPDGELIASGSDFARLVLPWWGAAAVFALTLFVVGAGRSD